MKNFFEVELVLEPRKGTTLSECAVEAAAIALTEYRKVVVTFNDTIYRAEPVELAKQVLETGQLCTHQKPM